MSTLLHLAVLTATILVLARNVRGVHVRSTGSALAVAIVFSICNWALGWLVKLLLVLPAILTFGLLFLVFPLLVNAVLLWLTDKILDSFELRGARALWGSALAITVVNALLELVLRTHHHHGAVLRFY
jgi:putative membrane protein